MTNENSGKPLTVHILKNYFLNLSQSAIIMTKTLRDLKMS